jgi:hypothetical protein
MNASMLVLLLQIAALCHLGLLCAGASTPKAVALGQHLALVPPFIRRLFYVYFSFIGMMLIGFAVLTFVFAPSMANGEPLARAVCVLLALFWTIRLLVAAFVFDVRPYLKNWFYRAGYWALNGTFIYLIAVYALAAWKGGRF